jgi:OmcA/MtrC family decaheme c-type cytochrome
MNRTLRLAVQILFLIVLLLLAGCAAEKTSREKTAVSPNDTALLKGERGERGPQGPQGKEGQPGKDYVPPPGDGLEMKIIEVVIPDNQRPVITLSIKDENGLPISPETLEGYGFTIAQVEEDSTTRQTRYQSLLVREVEGKPYKWGGETKQPVLEKSTQAFADNNGSWINQGQGIYSYTFNNRLSTPADPNRVTMVGLYAYKNRRTSIVNDSYSFVQGGTYPIAERQIVTNSACNLCHNPLQAHGGTRSEVSLCVACHTNQTIDPETGNTLEFNILIHRLHFGRELPSVQAGTPYYIIGFRQNVFDYSNDSWPQDLRYCITCHTGGAQSNNYKTSPSTGACTSCHDSTNMSTGENHSGGKQTDTTCSACHQPEGIEFDASIAGAHTIPARSKAVVGIELKILNVENVKPGSSPLLTYQVLTKGSEPLDVTRLTSLSVTMAGPTSDYQKRWTEPIYSANNPNLAPLTQASDGIYQYQFKAVIPENTTGAYAFAMEGYVMEKVSPDKDPVRIAAFNPVYYAGLDGGESASRREVVDMTSCNVCHMSIEAHGTIRKNVEYCVMCHNANATDAARRPAEAMPPETINFSLLIHRLHLGKEANQPLKVYGFGNQLHDYSKLIFPGNLNDCQKCHLPDTYGLPLLNGVLPTVITQDGEVVSSTLPVRALCTSCHDSQETQAHAELQTSAGGVETCNVCHGPGREFDVNKAHQ